MGTSVLEDACLEGAGNHKELVLKGPYRIICLWATNGTAHHHHLEGSLKHRWPGPTPRVSDLTAVGWGSRICISYKFPDNAGATGSGTTLGKPLSWSTISHTVLHGASEGGRQRYLKGGGGRAQTLASTHL